MAGPGPRPEPVLDPIWVSMRRDARDWLEREPALAGLLHGAVLDRADFEEALGCLLAIRLEGPGVDRLLLSRMFDEAVRGDPWIVEASRADISATHERDPACTSYLEPFILFKGYQALQAYRIAHSLWHGGRRIMACYLQSRASSVFGVDIHPAARIGKGIMIDHATGVVIGETAVIGEGVSLLHGVTLGGTGKERGDRHPKIGPGTMIGANASILGNISIGCCCKIGAGSVVLTDVPDNTTYAGVPAREVGTIGGEDWPALSMNQEF